MLQKRVKERLRWLNLVNQIFPIVEEVESLIPAELRTHFGKKNAGDIGEEWLYANDADVEGSYGQQGAWFRSCSFHVSVLADVTDIYKASPEISVELYFVNRPPQEGESDDAQDNQRDDLAARIFTVHAAVSALDDNPTVRWWYSFNAAVLKENPTMTAGSLDSVFLMECGLSPEKEQDISREQAHVIIGQMVRFFRVIKAKADARPPRVSDGGNDD